MPNVSGRPPGRLTGHASALRPQAATAADRAVGAVLLRVLWSVAGLGQGSDYISVFISVYERCAMCTGERGEAVCARWMAHEHMDQRMCKCQAPGPELVHIKGQEGLPLRQRTCWSTAFDAAGGVICRWFDERVGLVNLGRLCLWLLDSQRFGR